MLLFRGKAVRWLSAQRGQFSLPRNLISIHEEPTTNPKSQLTTADDIIRLCMTKHQVSPRCRIRNGKYCAKRYLPHSFKIFVYVPVSVSPIVPFIGFQKSSRQLQRYLDEPSSLHPFQNSNIQSNTPSYYQSPDTHDQT